MKLEYARSGLIGVLTPQANTTVEPEFWIMLPPGMALINARMISDKPSLEQRLVDYFDHVDDAVRQFHNAPVAAIAFATTGTSYIAGVVKERLLVEAVSTRVGVPFVTAGRAVVSALNLIGAREIGLVSPYPEGLTSAAKVYWEENGFKVVDTVQLALTSNQFHPIYSISAITARQALEDMSHSQLDAIVMLGTGMPTLGTILGFASSRDTPVLSCMTCLAWATIDAVRGNKPEQATLLEFARGSPWRIQYEARVPSRPSREH